jgi:hypothetical protein
LAALAACEEKTAPPSSKPAASLPAPVASGLPGDPTRVSGVVNPKKEAPYQGPTATLRGVVRGSGDVPSMRPDFVEKVAPECPKARAFYGAPFREGPQRELADAFVAVTGYQGYVPEPEPVVSIEARDCTWGTQTIALTFGQRIEVVSGDKNSYVPELLGSKMTTQLVATPFGKGTAQLYPPAVGRYVLVDNLRLFMTAEVLVLKYSTHDVTGADGRFEIAGIPPGKVKVNALLPATGAVTEKELELKGGETSEVELTLAFDAKKFEATLAAVPSASARPAPSSAPSARP